MSTARAPEAAIAPAAKGLSYPRSSISGIAIVPIAATPAMLTPHIAPNKAEE